MQPIEVAYVDKRVLADPRLSIAAKGLYALVACWNEGDTCDIDELPEAVQGQIAAALEELIAAGHASLDPMGGITIGTGRAPGGIPAAPAPRRAVSPARRSPSRAGWAYAVAGDHQDLVKIGTTRDVPTRLRSLQTASPYPLRVLWQREGGPALEEYLHLKFAARRVRGEWFDFTGVDAQGLIARAANSFGGGRG